MGSGKARVMALFGAKLHSVHWSLDGERSDGSIVFLGWKDDAVRGDGGSVTSCRLVRGSEDSLGGVERNRHLDAVVAGSLDSFLALAIAKDPDARPREIDAVLPVLYRVRLEARDPDFHAVVIGVEPLTKPDPAAAG